MSCLVLSEVARHHNQLLINFPTSELNNYSPTQDVGVLSRRSFQTLMKEATVLIIKQMENIISCDTNVVFQGYIPSLTGCERVKVKAPATYLRK